MRFDTFMQCCLYDDVIGYYRSDRERVGYGLGTDFFTASTSGPVFGELVLAAARQLLIGEDLTRYTLVEIGAERGRSVFDDVHHGFGRLLPYSIGDDLSLTGPCVVFSNELFDAQPVRRFRKNTDGWIETGVCLVDNRLVETDWASADADWLPTDAQDGYRIDAPVASRALLETLSRQAWHGLFIAFDYGKTWTELSQDTPVGTLRAYYQHQQSNAVLDRPGEQDLTAHVCWDWLKDELLAAGFASPQVESQEAFFIKHAADYLQQAMSEDATKLTPRKRSLMQLLHPSHLGQKFQVLHAIRK